MEGLLILERLKVEKVNSIAGLTWGFPAITNFLGFVHALSRKLPDDEDFMIDGCAVICHNQQNHVYRANSYSDYVFSLSRNPLKKDGKTASFAEEGKMHLEVSLIIPIEGDLDEFDENMQEEKVQLIEKIVPQQRLAGGTITSLKSAKIIEFAGESTSQQIKRELRKLLPGFALIHKPEALKNHYQELKNQNSEAEMIDAWLDFSAIRYQAHKTTDEENDDKAEWKFVPKPDSGYLVPIPIGYRAISKLYESNEVENTRDNETPFRFVEWAYSIGEWVSPHRIRKIEEAIWKYDADPESGWYLCKNNSKQNEINQEEI